MDFSSVYGLNLVAPSIIKMQVVLPGGPVMKMNFIVLETELTNSSVCCEPVMNFWIKEIIFRTPNSHSFICSS
jgi:hypothetical protein